MVSVKTKVLLGIRQMPNTANPKDLRLLAETDEHNVVHILYSLKKQGLIGFREKKDGTLQVPYNIHLTKQGERALRKIR